MAIENRIYTQIDRGKRWLQQYRGRLPLFACVLGFTETGLIPGISAAGKTPEDRRFTAIADAEFLEQAGELRFQHALVAFLCCGHRGVVRQGEGGGGTVRVPPDHGDVLLRGERMSPMIA